MTEPYNILVVGGGIVGLATALALSENRGLRLLVLEAEDRLAAHQTGNNSGVIHSGLYYRPGSLKAINCVEGREALYRFCAEEGITHERCGKVVVATAPEQLPALEELERRGGANGLEGLRRLDAGGIRDLEPHCRGVAGLHVPATGIVDFTQVCQAMARRFTAAGGEIRLGAKVTGCRRQGREIILETGAGSFRGRNLVACAGLHCDRLARLCGVDPQLRIVPFRGEYYDLRPEAHHLVRNLIYPVPDPRFPFLGVHFTRMAGGGVEAGPNAVLAFKREGYRKSDISLRDMADWLFYPGFWKMAARYWRMSLGEMHRSFSKAAFVRSMQELIPAIQSHQVHRGGAGVRAQALEADGKLVDDFRIVQEKGMIHVLNAPSPAATAALSIGRRVAAMAAENFDLPRTSLAGPGPAPLKEAE